MKFANHRIVFLLFIREVLPCQSFVVLSTKSSKARATTLGMSTLAPTTNSLPTAEADDDDGQKKNHERNVQPAPAVRKKGGISMTMSELADELGGWGRAQLVWDCYSIGVDPALFYGSVIRLGHDDFETVHNLLPSPRRSQSLGKAALDRLATLYDSTPKRRMEGGVASLSHISVSGDSTTKFLLRLSDGLEIETVIIPWTKQDKKERSTLCVSSQVGCRQGCTFCATGRMGKMRSLTSDEILAQMFFAKKICRLNGLPDITNVVFMGMGEPADNVEAVKDAVNILTTRELFQLSATKVTVSTVGPTPLAFRQLLSNDNCVVAFSVHAARDELRRQLVPSTKYRMSELRQGLIDALLERPANFRTVMLEVTLIADVNDSLREAAEMADFCRVIVDSVPRCKLVVNLIPYNDTSEHQQGSSTQLMHRKPSQERIRAFQNRLWESDLFAYIRTTRGDDEAAACGQLATARKKREVYNNNGQDLQ